MDENMFLDEDEEEDEEEEVAANGGAKLNQSLK